MSYIRDHNFIPSEIYQVTGPVERFASQIASQGYVVGTMSLFLLYPALPTSKLACPSIYHEFEGPEAIPYDVEGDCYLA
jgi:carboxymethylenebutenolidase